MRSNPSSDPSQQALHALLAIVSSEYFLGEELGMFVGAPEGRTIADVNCAHVINQTTDWCMSALHAAGSALTDGEAFADEVTYELLGWARAAIGAVHIRDVEATYLSALSFIAGDFCAIWEELGQTCTGTPLPILRIALTECLRHEYGVDIAAPEPRWAAVMNGAYDLANRWRSWATK